MKDPREQQTELRKSVFNTMKAADVINTAAIKEAIATEAKATKSVPADFKGKKNIYTCEACFEHVVTVDLVEGVTPFMIPCQCTEGCKGMMKSSFYRVFDQSMKASHEWYRPTSLDGLSTWSRDHVEKGGLMLRKAER